MLTHRLATSNDLEVVREIMRLAVDLNQRAYLNAAEISASYKFMGLDTQLVDDSSYFIVEEDGRAIGCGGWSRRATLYGGDHSTALREPRELDPATEAARVRAMYTHPDFVRRGVGRLILQACEAAAYAHGFRRVELMATLAGEPLYRACGYEDIERTTAGADGLDVPLIRMGKRLTAQAYV